MGFGDIHRRERGKVEETVRLCTEGTLPGGMNQGKDIPSGVETTGCLKQEYLMFHITYFSLFFCN
jgi:hypothetical protein